MRFLISTLAKSTTILYRGALLGSAGLVFFTANSATVHAQLPTLPGEEPPGLGTDALPPGENEAFEFSNDDALGFGPSADELQEQARKEAFDAALEGLLPLRPEEIRTLLERFDRTQESVQTPVYPNPKPEVVVKNISLDPGAEPISVKMAYGHVTTISFLDSSGAPWPVQDVSWAGNFEVLEVQQEKDKFTHVFRISPQSEYAYGNMSITMTGLMTPVIITLDTNRDVVHYRVDAVLPDFGPLAEAPIIDTGITTSAGDQDLAQILQGSIPSDAVRLDVSGADGRTSAYRYNELVYVRTPLTLLSPGWNSSATSADGTRVYEIDDAPVLLLSDRGRMVRARLSSRGDMLEELLDE